MTFTADRQSIPGHATPPGRCSLLARLSMLWLAVGALSGCQQFIEKAACSPALEPVTTRFVREPADALTPVDGTPLTFVLTRERKCGDLRNETVSVFVNDDQLSQLPSMLETTATEQLYTARISFTPPKPGNYHVTAAYEPSLGTFQTNVFVGVAAPQVTSRVVGLTSEYLCRDFSLAANGSVGCHYGGKFWVNREGQTAENIVASHGVFSGNDLWLIEGKTLSRFEDDGAHLIRRVGPLALSLLGNPVKLLVHENDVWVVDDDFAQLIYLHFENDTPQVFYIPLPTAFGLKRENVVNYAFALTDQGALWAAVNTSGQEPNVCHVEPRTNGRGVRCVHHAGQVQTADRTGVWFTRAADNLTDVDHVEIGDALVPTRITQSFTLPATYTLWRPSPYDFMSAFVYATDTGTDLVLKSTAQGIVGEVWPQQKSMRLLEVTPQAVFYADSINPHSVKIFPR